MTTNNIVLISFFLTTIAMSCTKKVYLADVQDRSYRIEKASFPIDPDLAEMIEPYKTKLDKTMNEVLATSDEELVKGKPSSTLTNWFADVLLEESQKLVTDKIDFAIQNYGGIRIPTLAKGDITVGKVYELMPFDNIMYVMELPGNIVQMLFDKMAESGGWPISGTVNYEIAYGKAKNIQIRGKSLDANSVYIVAIPDYIAAGGDNMDFLKAITPNNTGALIRDLIISNLRSLTASGKTIKPINDKRIIE